MKTILISGATGFLGSHLVKTFVLNDYKVIALKRLNSNTEKINNYLDSISIFNIEDRHEIVKLFEKNKIDVVINASVAYDRTDSDPYEVISANLLLPTFLIDLASKHNTSIFINTDSYFTHMHYGRMKNYTLSKIQFKDWLLNYSERMIIFNMVILPQYSTSFKFSFFEY